MSAKDKATGREQSIKITASSGLAKDQVDQMVKDAEQHAEEDRKRKAEIEARNKADNAHYQVQKFLQDNGDKMTDEDKQSLQEQHGRGRRPRWIATPGPMSWRTRPTS